MNLEQQRATLSVALLATFADGNNDDREREQIRRLVETLGGDNAALDMPGLYREVLLRHVDLDRLCAVFATPGERRFAFEMAVCLCDADGIQTAAEKNFLDDLRRRLKLSPGTAAEVSQAPDEFASLLQSPTMANSIGQAPVAAAPALAVNALVPEAELERSVLNYAILNGALELLPQSWASMAIIPLQVKMVYGIGKAYGNELDQAHIKEFIATVGVGLTSQYLEQMGRRLLGGLLDRFVGGTAARLGRAATGIAFSFATTWALGQIARRYYAGGRRMTTEVLRQTYAELLGPAKSLQAKYLPQIEQQAAGLDAGKVMAIVRGSL